MLALQACASRHLHDGCGLARRLSTTAGLDLHPAGVRAKGGGFGVRGSGRELRERGSGPAFMPSKLGFGFRV
jgi:hypothetical protein